jgi:glucose-6-phosphate isomerase
VLVSFVNTTADVTETLERLRVEDVLGQLIERRGRMAELATEDGDPKLDWVDQVAWALAHPERLAELEQQAAELVDRFDHLIWAGMGGSVQTVHALKALGLLDRPGFTVHPLDSTDPAALNRLLEEIGGEAGLTRTAMVGVSLAMTSEEPITHLEWFDEVLRSRGLDPGAHLLVMTLPGSLLDRFAHRRRAPRHPLQLDGQCHVPGRMSAPSTLVFLLPAALALAPEGGLREVLERCQAEFQLGPGLGLQDRSRLIRADPFCRLAAWLGREWAQGRDMVLLETESELAGLGPWVEQVVEESLGKAGQGLLAFYDQDPGLSRAPGVTRLRIAAGAVDGPALELEFPADDRRRCLATVARFFAGWNLAVALLGYLRGITFAGQPAVENYKRYARELRQSTAPLPYPDGDLESSPDDRLHLFWGALGAAGLNVEWLRQRARAWGDGPSALLAAVLAELAAQERLGYLDLTLNADPKGPLWEAAQRGARLLAGVLGLPVKVRSGPRDYHSTEQSETDGPPRLLSLRVLVRRSERVALGRYESRFLHAQALGTLLAMRDAGRPVLLVLLEDSEASPLQELLERAARLLQEDLAAEVREATGEAVTGEP